MACLFIAFYCIQFCIAGSNTGRKILEEKARHSLCGISKMEKVLQAKNYAKECG